MIRTSKTAFAAVLVCALLLGAGCGRYAPPIRPPAPERVITPDSGAAAGEAAPDEPAPEGWEFEDEPGSETP